ncbi:MAG: hypothetical protein QMD85_05910 [Candidatus Aenigmarchaeota archaeon]|nr:hypothetical protein [Candidatus Aenigmarchaeota archaeon]
MQNLLDQVLVYLRAKGPSLPVQVSKAVNRDIIFAGAALSELVSKKEVKITKAKVGGSPLYYIPGDEPKLEILYNYLPSKEKEAYALLKQKKFLYDNNLEPAIRVALSSIKDFAVPIQKGNEIVWMWHLENPNNLIQKKEIPAPEIKPQIQAALQPKKSRAKKEENFSPMIESYLASSSIKILEKEIIRKNTEINYRIAVNTQLGPLEFLVCAKNKKKITETDLAMAHQKAQSKKMHALFLTNGDLAKKADEYMQKALKGHLIFRKI